MPSSNEVELAIIVNGQPVIIEANRNAPIHTVIPKALEASGTIGQPPENWELRDASGELLPLDRKIEDFNFPPDVKLLLNLKAGVGGA
jgi:Protein of Unknown function (DUF2604)